MIAFTATRLLCGLVFILGIATSSTSPGPCGISHLYAPATLKSPLYPSSYPNSIDCNWTISYTNGSRILLTFSSFSLESHSLCNYDYLDVYDGDSSYAKKLGRYCGSQLPQSIISSGSHLFIAFHSDGSQQKQGFVLNFTNKFEKYECYECHKQASCINTNGTLHCSCNNGFTGNGSSCTDVNECEIGTNNCNGNASCNNTIGSFNCVCNIGFVGDGTTCEEITICPKRIDLGFILDSSGSIGRYSFDQTKSFVKDLTKFFTISQNSTRVSVMSYATGATLHFRFSRVFGTRQNLYSAIDNIPYSGGGTNTHLALLRAYTDMFNAKNGSRVTGVKKVLIVFTDGHSFGNVYQPSQQLKNMGVVIYSFGVGNGVHMPELRTMASSPANNHVFLLRNFHQLSTLERNISYSACNDNFECYRCDIHASCLKSNGSFQCFCNVGYTGNGLTCTDVNECEIGTNNCNSNASCNNTIGSFRCACNVGYVGDGIKCRNLTICAKKIDLGFVMDSSSSIGHYNFNQTKLFIKDFTDYFKISENGTRVSVITYATWPTLQFGFSRKFTTRQDLYSEIDNIPYTGYWGADTERALTKAYIDMFDTQNGARISGIKRILIVFTDGRSSGNVYYPSQQLKNMGVVIFSIGVGSGIDVLQLETMASSPAKDHVFLLRNFSEFAHLAHNISFIACNGITTNITRDSCGNTHLYTPGRLTSPRYPYEYPRQLNCSWIISSTNATYVSLQFSVFSLEGGSSCQYDYLDVYDGNSIYAKKLGRFCGQQSPRKLVSSGSTLFVVFHTDSIIQKQGFVLNYTDTNDSDSCGNFYLYTPGRLTSPLHPYYYPRNTDCTWIISSTSAANVLLQFSFFSLEYSSSCQYDYLDVYDGNSMYARKLGRFCGQQLPRKLWSSGSKLFIVFHTDGGVQKQGFVLNYTSTTDSCGNSYLYTPGRLTSPRYPYDYPRNTDCTWNISSNNATNVLLKFSFFWLEGGSSCRYDYLDVYDGNSMYAKKLGRFCGQQFPRKLVSSGSKLFIVFHTDGSDQEQGFVLDYTSTIGRNVTICTKKIDLGFVMDSSGSIGFDNFNKSKSFLKDFTDYFKISPNETRVSVITYATWPTLHFRFSRIFKTRQDLYLAIDNIPYSGGGTNTARALTKAYIDMFDTRNGARISGIKRILIVFTDGKSSGNVYYPSQQLKDMGVIIFSIGVGSGIDVLELKTMASSPAKDHVFLLHNFNQFAHLAQNMSFNACNGNTTNITRASTTPHLNTVSSTPLPNRASCGNIYLYTPGILTSPFYPNDYLSNTNCTWIISSTNGTYVLLQFSFFSLEGGSSCPYDYLDVYDGNFMYAKKLGRFCGQQLPRKLVSSGSKLLILFHTDSSVQKQGFVLNYTDTNDTNKCSGAPCAPYANCTKINGSYVCVCKPGYNRNGTSCTDIDECNGPNNCSPNAVCHNVVGSYTCDCSHGYHGDGTRCDDIDECRDQPQKCTGAGESCTNYPGRYRCGCISSGQQFIDNKCTDIQASVQGEFRIINRQYIPAFNIINSAEYFEFTEMLINELTSLYRRTPKIHSTFRLIIILRLFPGSVGFEYVATFSDKKGIDLGNIQDELAHSLQVTHDGTFLGNGLKISDSTNITEVGKRLRVQDIDECSEDSNSCPANSECKNTIGSFTCSCNSGYVGNGTICQVSEISKEPTEHGTKWYIFVIIIVAGIVIGLLIAYVVACLRRRYLKRKVLCNADVQHSYQNSVYELDVAKLEDNFYESGGTASRESSPPYEELSNVRDPENTYGSLK